ncbi:MAG TPA: selenocysteine-specific translation elongation factor [Pyrinomonadaceae bacterium]|nr:selenocysteine-specific translation elongation factor [Pyrinomonadaceae bacterium]
MEVIVGTAGHIDHGKTALVGALTGIDTDRLPEEKRRGITIDLGFAEMSVGDTHFAFVDVPGHERFVRNMLAGASGVDIVLLVVAAGEGVMPQTREHFEICRLLGLGQGVIAITKCDLVAPETLELAKGEVRELVAGSFLQSAGILPVSVKTGKGIEALKDALMSAAVGVSGRSNRQVTFLPIDRSFSVKGFGTVVTGTLASGAISDGDELVLLPADRRVRVRGLQSHGRDEGSVVAGRRVAVNLSGIERDEISRGDVLTGKETLVPTPLLDCEVEVIAASTPLRSRQRVRVHIGTAEVLARVQVLNPAYEIAAGDTDLVQLRLETPVAAFPGQRFILRAYSPEMTIGGGVVIDIGPAKHRRRDVELARSLLHDLLACRDDSEKWVTTFIRTSKQGLLGSEIGARTGLNNTVLDSALNGATAKQTLVNAKGRYLAAEAFGAIRQKLVSAITEFHAARPLERGITRAGLSYAACNVPIEVFDAVLNSLASEGKVVIAGDVIQLASFGTQLSPEEQNASDHLLALYERSRLEVPRLNDALVEAANESGLGTTEVRKLFQLLITDLRVVKVTDEFYFSSEAIDDVVRRLKAYADASSERLIDVPKFKELVGVSRKYAIPLLEYLDSQRITSRSGDKRIIV